MHASYIRPGGVAYDIPKGFLHDIYDFIKNFSKKINDIEEMLNFNRIFKERVSNIGIVSSQIIENYSFSGVMMRGSGIPSDLRKIYNYEDYNSLSFKIPIGSFGDCFDRYLVRMHEIRESLSLMEQVCNLLELSGQLLFILNILFLSRFYET